MIHPHTKLLYVSDAIGYGVFATEFIPKGTITYVKDALEPEITPEQYATHSPVMQQVIEKYSYIDQNGVRIVSWDFGRFVNHCCNCNTISTGYGFEIAIRDIFPDEEITDEYGLFNMPESFPLVCKHKNCRLQVSRDDIDAMYPVWDEQIKAALQLVPQLEQPLWDFMDAETIKDLNLFRQNPSKYKSVRLLKYEPALVNGFGSVSMNGRPRELT
jgi:uncharacterized protein